MRCRLSRRQRRLYDEYMSSAETHETLQGGNFMGIISWLMQLRKVKILLRRLDLATDANAGMAA